MSPTRTKRAKPNPLKLYVAWDSASIGEHVVKGGARLRGDHPAVVHAPWLFLPADTPDDEISRHRQKAYQAELAQTAVSARQTGEQAVQVLDPPSPLRDEDAVVATRPAGEGVKTSGPWADPTGRLRMVDAGHKLHRDDPLVKRDPDAFVEVTNGIPRESAMVALQRVSNQDEHGKVRTVHQGQWADLDDPLVTSNRHAFERVGYA